VWCLKCCTRLWALLVHIIFAYITHIHIFYFENYNSVTFIEWTHACRHFLFCTFGVALDLTNQTRFVRNFDWQLTTLMTRFNRIFGQSLKERSMIYCPMRVFVLNDECVRVCIAVGCHVCWLHRWRMVAPKDDESDSDGQPPAPTSALAYTFWDKISPQTDATSTPHRVLMTFWKCCVTVLLFGMCDFSSKIKYTVTCASTKSDHPCARTMSKMCTLLCL